ncbi:MAG: endonuclease domain-containing protein [Chloroflexi bacterium]|nr:endonuclease domain-containing protein [Chloroflexota bacterium]
MGTRHRIYPPMLECAREMRHPQTAAEATLWRALRNRSQCYKFRRQHPIDRFIVDFYCAEAKLCIEVDGDSHAERAQAEYDAARTAFLEEVGYRVIRFTNNDVCYSIHAVVNEIISAIARILLPSPQRGEG